mgnify:CR=1 FL=1
MSTLQMTHAIAPCLDAEFDRIDFALGRPKDPLTDTERNHYQTRGTTADKLAASPYWREVHTTPVVRYFVVTQEGREALAAQRAALTAAPVGPPAKPVVRSVNPALVESVYAGRLHMTREFSGNRFPQTVKKNSCPKVDSLRTRMVNVIREHGDWITSSKLAKALDIPIRKVGDTAGDAVAVGKIERRVQMLSYGNVTEYRIAPELGALQGSPPVDTL